MSIPILTGVKSERISCLKNGRISSENLILKLNFQDEGTWMPIPKFSS